MSKFLAFHPDQIRSLPDGWKCLMVPPTEFDESRMDAARAQGWIVLGRDSDVYGEVVKVENAQRNPNRCGDPGDETP